jgi:hypothetical protein
MKRLLLTLSLIGLAIGACAQGQINLRNIFNSDTSPTATSNGLFWAYCPGALALIQTDFNVNFYGGPNANSLILLKSFVASGGGAVAGPGTFFDLSGVTVTVQGAVTSAVIKIEAWIGSADYFSSTSRGSAVFINPLGNPFASPPDIPPDLTGMPAIIIGPLTCVPEPSTFALVGLGAGALLLFPRRKSW